MAVCARCRAEFSVPEHITVGRVRCPNCREPVEVRAAPPAPPVVAPARGPGVAAQAPAVAPVVRPTAVGRAPVDAEREEAPAAEAAELMRRCPRCGRRFAASRGARCPKCGESLGARREALEREQREGDGFAPERAGLNAGVLGGIVMVAIAVVWFVAGLHAGYIYFYPPILAVLGVVGIARGISDGNFAGRGGAARPVRRRRSRS